MNKNNQIKNIPILKNFFLILSGTASIQVLNFVLTPLLTRLFQVDDFGFLGIFNTTITLLVILCGLCYPLAIVMTQKEHLYKNILSTTFKISAMLCITMSIVLLTIKFNFDTKINPIVYFLCAAIFPSSISAILTQVLIRKQKFKELTLISLYTTIVTSAAKIIAGYSLPNFESLIIAVIIGLYINTFLLCAKTKTFKLPTKLLSFDRKNIVVIKKFKQLPRFRLPHALINNLSQMAPLILLTYYFGIKEAGYFVLTRTVLMVPVNLLGKAVYDVSYPKLSADFSRKPITKYLYLSTFGLMACSLLPILLLVFFGEELFSFVFGDAWSTSGIYAGCIAIWFSFNISNRACIAAVTLLNLDKFLLKNGILNITLATSGFMACIHFGATDTTSLMVFFMMSVIAQISLISKVLIASKQHDKKHCKEFKT